MKVTVTVCDVCEGADTTQYEIKSQGKNVKVDLCSNDAKPFERFLADAKPRGRAAAAAKQATPRRRATRKTTVEEIEAKKK